MKNVIFVWIAMFLFAGLVVASGFSTFPVPFDGAIILLGSAISGYTGVKSLSVTLIAKDLPTGKGVDQKTKDKITQILIGLYIIIAESIIIQIIKPDVLLPLNNLFIMAGVCTGVILAGNQAIKLGESKNG